MNHFIQLLEEELLSADVRQSREKMDQFLSADFFEFGSSGKTYDKKSVLENLRQLELKNSQIADFTIVVEEESLVICSYRLLLNSFPHSFRSSVWCNNNDEWQMRFHQASKID
ncbi:nuclear transport factor 2 family protein [bacterium]|nr:nuclear transport factor 2 family protein [bacterium]NCQ55386.1 nuclear transport factor 2 family protein [Candidatus Parcubacteria bacterium]NCS67748.1 nuclear transport factor 2 family protein [Candidatus Peregrinibacteria bacterium]NCS96438.1 nuclear transport factor 2 family protein [bacterium]